jgi:hypothetical protein
MDGRQAGDALVEPRGFFAFFAFFACNHTEIGDGAAV